MISYAAKHGLDAEIIAKIDNLVTMKTEGLRLEIDRLCAEDTKKQKIIDALTLKHEELLDDLNKVCHINFQTIIC